jgi:hypothetical protein
MKTTRSSIALAISVATVVIACRSSSDDAPPSVPCSSTATTADVENVSPASVGVFVETSSDARMGAVSADVASYLSKMWGANVAVVDGPPSGAQAISIWISSSANARAKAGVADGDAGYAIERVSDASGSTIVVAANDADDLSAGAYALLETLGARFFHPMQELVPSFGAARLPKTIDVRAAALTKQRGVQLHLLHPIEYFQTFMQPSDASLAEAKRVIDWLVKTGQNHLQFPLLSTVDFDAWKPHMTAIVDYAHARGVTIGAVLQVWGGAALQNNFVLVSDATKWQTQMDAQLDRALQIDWDAIDLALGEFLSTDPQTVIDWMNHAVDHVATTHPRVEVNVQNHVGNYPKLWVQYMGQTVFYYHLPQFADARLGQVVHTLSLFDLYRDWATYAHPDFHLQHDYIVKELPSRRVKYFPESAYWITADDDIPQFLPEFVFARWTDVHGLSSDLKSLALPPLEGHVTFSSGHEWGYWLTDYLTAKMLWRPDGDFASSLVPYTSAFGDCSSDVQSSLAAFVDLQTKYLFDARLLAYVQGEDTTVDYGYITGLETHPKRVAFEDVLAMDDASRATFEHDVVQGLEALASQTKPIEDAIAARCRGADETIAPWCDELWDGIEIDRLRTEHAAHLYRAVLDRARGQDPEGEFSAALADTDQARAVVARREPHYRFDLSRTSDAYANPTVYGYGYLRTVHTLCLWTRREEQARYLLDEGVGEGIGGLPTCQD